MSYFVTYFAHPKAPYITVSEEGAEESVTVFVREDDNGNLSIDGLPPIEENHDGWESVKTSKNGVDYIHNRLPFEAVFDGLNAATRIASRVTLRRVTAKAVHLGIKRAAKPVDEAL